MIITHGRIAALVGIFLKMQQIITEFDVIMPEQPLAKQ